MKYNELTIQQKALVMRDAVRAGVTSLDAIERQFNSFKGGGLLSKVFAPKYDGTFKEAFRKARENGDSYFKWDGRRFNTEIVPNPMTEAARQWDTKGSPAREDFRRQVIQTPNEVLEYYNTAYPIGKYTSVNQKINNYDLETMYTLGTKGVEGLVMNRNANSSIGDRIWKSLNKSKLSYNQKLAILANSYHETNGWVSLEQYNNGPASGAYMMESAQQAVYNKWLKKNKLPDSVENQTNFVVSLFENDDESLVTAWDRASTNQEKIKSYKDSDEAYKNGYRAAYNHMGYTTKNAKEDWNSDNLDNSVKAFEGLFERAGIPMVEKRQRIASILQNYYK